MHDPMNDKVMKKAALEHLLQIIHEAMSEHMAPEHGAHGEGHPAVVEIDVEKHSIDPQNMEKMEEQMHQDLDNDNEEGESPEHKAKVMGDEESPEHESGESQDEEMGEPDLSPEEDDDMMASLAEKRMKKDLSKDKEEY